jgi:hypothetical protein
MNRFMRINAGIFAATNAGPGQPPTLAERIVAGVCAQIATADGKLLDEAWWLEVVGNIPFQTQAAVKSTKRTFTAEPTPAQLAVLCVASDSPLLAGIEDFISKVPGNFQSLDCFSASYLTDDSLRMTLAITAIDRANADSPVVSTTTSVSDVNYGRADAAQELHAIFDGFSLLDGQPFYISSSASQ